MNMLNICPAVVAEQTRHRHKLTGTRSLEVPGPGAVAHMSLHQKSTMSKNHQTVIADSHAIPDLHRGTGYPFVLATNASAKADAVCAASVEPIYEPFMIRSTGFCNFISLPRKNRRIPPFFAYFRPVSRLPDGPFGTRLARNCPESGRESRFPAPFPARCPPSLLQRLRPC